MSGLFDQITNYSPPLLTAGQVNYKGTWSAAANSPTLTSPPPATSKGDYYVVSAAGTQFGITFAVGDWIISNGTAWEKVDLTDSVSSVFGRTGAVVSANGDYTASQVTNVPAGTISSTNVQDAINELSTDISTAQNVLDAIVTNAESVAITKGQVVYAFGATGNRMSVKLALNTSDATSAKTVGVVLDSSIGAGNTGNIRMVGVVDGLNLGAYNDGDTLYLGATAGSVTSTKPYAPNHLVYVGIVERANNGNGQLYVRVQNGYELDEIHDVQITSAPASGALLVRDATNSLWKAARLTAGTNIAITNADASVTVGITGVIAGTNGGTGVDNGANTLTLAGNVTHAGAFTQSFTATANTSLTLPTTGTLATLAGSEALSNKTITASSFSGSVAATTLSTSGDAGIGTASPTQRLQVSSSAGSTYALITNTSTGPSNLFLGAGNATTQLISRDATTGAVPISVIIGTTERANFSSTGLAVTGALSLTGAITISGSPSGQGAGVRYISGAATSMDLYSNAATGGVHYWAIGESIKATLTGTGLGIGTTSPSYRLDVRSLSTATAASFSSTNTTAYSATSYNGGAARMFISTSNATGAVNGIEFTTGGNNETFFGVVQESGGAGAFVFQGYTGAAYTERMRIDSSGNVGIGTTSPSSRLTVADSVGGAGMFFVANKGVGATGSGAFGLSYNTVNYTPGSASSSIYWDGGTGWFTLSTSSRKYKRNIVAVTDEQLDKALLLKPSYYQRNEHDYFEYGFIAEEVNEVGLDEFVTRVEGEISGLNYEKMVTLAIGLAQRQAKENANLVAELQSLRQRVAALESN